MWFGGFCGMDGLPGKPNDYDDQILTSETIGEFCMKMRIRGISLGIPDCAELLAERAVWTHAQPDENEKEIVSRIFGIILRGIGNRGDKMLQGLGTKRMFSTIMVSALDALSSVMGPNEDVTYGEDMRITAFSLITLIIHRLDPGFIGNLRDSEGNNPLMCIVRSSKLDVIHRLVERTGFPQSMDSLVERNRPMMEAIFALLSVGCDPNAKNKYGYSLLSFLSDELVNEYNIRIEKRKLLDKARGFGIILDEYNT